MSTEVLVLLNDGQRLSIGRVIEGEIEQAPLPCELPVTSSVSDRFLATRELVLDQDRLGLEVTRTFARPFLPPPPQEGGWPPSFLSPGYACVCNPLSNELLTFDGDGWKRRPVPDDVELQEAVFDHAWIAGGARGRESVVWDVESGRELNVPWRRRRWAHSGNTMLDLQSSRAGLVVRNNEGWWERDINHLYVRTGQDWAYKYLGRDWVSTVTDPDGLLPPILLGSGKWLTIRSGRPKLRQPLKLTHRATAALHSRPFRRPAWQAVAVHQDVVTALVSVSPWKRHVLLQGRAGERLDVIAQSQTDRLNPVDIRIGETDLFD